MIEMSEESIGVLKQIYIVANTPCYLYKHFKREMVVEMLARIYSAEKLVEHIVEIDNKKRRTLADVTSAYAACVALTFHEVRLVSALMNEMNLRTLEWVDAIVKIWEKSYVPKQVVDIHYTHKPDVRLEGKQESDVGTERIDIAYNHKQTIGDQNLFRSDSSETDIICNGEKDD